MLKRGLKNQSLDSEEWSHKSEALAITVNHGDQQNTILDNALFNEMRKLELFYPTHHR